MLKEIAKTQSNLSREIFIFRIMSCCLKCLEHNGAYRVLFSDDVTAAMLVSQSNPVGIELFSYVNTHLFQYICINAGHVSENAPYLEFKWYEKRF